MSTSDERPPSGPAGAGNEAATPASDAEEARRPVEVFRFALGETLLAFPVEALERVMAEQTPTPLPGITAPITGLIPYGREALVTIELGQLLGVATTSPRRDATEDGELRPRRLLVLRVGEDKAGLTCDHALGVATLEVRVNARPAVLTEGRLADFLEAEVTTDEGLIGVLNPTKILEAARARG